MVEILGRFLRRNETVQLSLDGSIFKGEISTLNVDGSEIPLVNISPEGKGGITTLGEIHLNKGFYYQLLGRTSHWNRLQRYLSGDTVLSIKPDVVSRSGTKVNFTSQRTDLCHVEIVGVYGGNVIDNDRLNNVSPEDFNLVYYNSDTPIVAINISLQVRGN